MLQPGRFMSETVSLLKLQKLQALCSWDLKDYYSEGANAVCAFFPTNLHVWRPKTDLRVPVIRKHQRFALHLTLSGQQGLCVDGRNFQIPAGKGILIFPFQSHTNVPLAEGEEPYERMLVNFHERPEHAGSLLPLRNRVIDIRADDFTLLEQICLGYKELENRSYSDAVCALIWFCIRQVERVRQLEANVLHEDESLFRRIHDYILKNLDRPLTLQTIESKFNISNSTLRRIFQRNQSLSTSPGRLIQILKLNRSLDWVQCLANPIAEIAEWCGYSDQFAFSRAFKKRFGLSPLQMRRHKKQKRV